MKTETLLKADAMPCTKYHVFADAQSAPNELHYSGMAETLEAGLGLDRGATLVILVPDTLLLKSNG